MSRRLHGRKHSIESKPSIEPVYPSSEYDDFCQTQGPSRPSTSLAGSSSAGRSSASRFSEGRSSEGDGERMTALMQRKTLMRQLDRLFDETERLRAENRQLKQEKQQLEDENRRLAQACEGQYVEDRRLIEQNKEMREQLTLLRLYQEGKVPADLEHRVLKEALTRALSPEAADFFHALPSSLNFASYFSRADEHDLGEQEAKDLLLRLIQEELLIPKGHRLEKAHRARDFA